MSTFLFITALCALGILLVLLFCLAAPLALHLEFILGKEEPEADFGLYWVHPKIVSVSLDKDANPIFSIFGKKRQKSDEPPPTGTTAPQHNKPEGTSPKTPPTAQTSTITNDTPVYKTYSSPSIPPQSHQEPPKEAQKRPTEPFWSSVMKKLKKFRISIRKNRVLYMLRQTRWRKKVVRWLKHSIPRFFRIISLKKCDIQVSYGSEDPALTGMVYGWIMALKGILVPRRIVLSITPYFNADELSGSGTILFKTSIARLIHPVVCALFTFPWVHTWIVWHKASKNYKTFSAMEVAPHAEHS